ncbi:hypothetical protein GCM10020254_34600 [Streptomyces goshikiensis]
MTLPILLGVLLLGALLLAGALYALRGVRPVRAVTGAGEAAEAAGADEAELKSRRAAEVVALGFVPEAELDTAHPAPVPAERTAVLAALADGDWEVGAAYLKAAGRDWEERWLRVRVLAGAAAGDDGWLRAWREAKPSHPALALVAADTAVVVAWNARGEGGRPATSPRNASGPSTACWRRRRRPPARPSGWRTPRTRSRTWSSSPSASAWATRTRTTSGCGLRSRRAARRC